jgi:hypothetical protein
MENWKLTLLHGRQAGRQVGRQPGYASVKEGAFWNTPLTQGVGYCRQAGTACGYQSLSLLCAVFEMGREKQQGRLCTCAAHAVGTTEGRLLVYTTGGKEGHDAQ